MTKYFIHIFFVLAVAFIVVAVLNNQKDYELPEFVKVDELVLQHKTEIKLEVNSYVKPSQQQLEMLRKDYNAIWAHLNHLYETNETKPGMEYYTEGFFNFICSVAKPLSVHHLKREDLEHKLHITEWARDGLVCVALDSNVVFRYQPMNGEEYYTKANIAVALLLQGEHWRIDAIEFINEEKILK